MSRELIAIIPARAGSKGLTGKNMRLLARRSLVQHAIDAAQGSGAFREIWVSSDDDAALALASRCGVRSVRRPAALSADTTDMVEVIEHLDAVLTNLGSPHGDAFALLQPTSPLRTAAHIRDCVTAFCAGHWASAVSVTPLSFPPQKALVLREGALVPLLSTQALHTNRQALEPTYRQNGAIWIVAWTAFRRERHFVVAPAMPFEMKPEESIDIDSAGDLQHAERQLAAAGLGMPVP